MSTSAPVRPWAGIYLVPQKKGTRTPRYIDVYKKNRKMNKNVIENISFTVVVIDFILRVATRDPRLLAKLTTRHW